MLEEKKARLKVKQLLPASRALEASLVEAPPSSREAFRIVDNLVARRTNLLLRASFFAHSHLAPGKR